LLRYIASIERLYLQHIFDHGVSRMFGRKKGSEDPYESEVQKSVVIRNLLLALAMSLILTSDAAASVATIGPPPGWTRLLGGVGGMKIQDESKRSFFLTSSGDPSVEYRALVDRLLDPTTARFYACRFPARYVALRRSGIVPSVDLSQCSVLSDFVRGFRLGYLSIGLASEHFGSPASLFGHVMLVFHAHEVPTLDSDAVHFAAVAQRSEGSLAYIWKGLTGGFSGVYSRVPLFKKVHEYTQVSQRTIFFQRLNLSKEQIVNLIYHLFELRELKFEYTFLRRNCAQYLSHLITVAQGLEIESLEGTLYALPIEVIYHHRAILSASAYSLLPDTVRFQRALGLIPAETRNSLERLAHGEGTDVPNSNDDRVLDAASLLYEVVFRTKRVLLPGYSLRRSRELIPRITASDASVPGPLSRTFPGRIGLGAGIKDRLPYQTVLLRPALLDLRDNQFGSTNESILSVLESRLALLDSRLRVEQVKILELGVLTQYERILQNVSWRMGFGFSRENVQEKLALNGTFEIGGVTRISKAMGVGALLGPGIEVGDPTVVPFLNGRILAFGYLNPNLKVTFSGLYKRPLLIDSFALVSMETTYWLSQSYSASVVLDTVLPSRGLNGVIEFRIYL
jgi:hypothetical protein